MAVEMICSCGNRISTDKPYRECDLLCPACSRHLVAPYMSMDHDTPTDGTDSREHFYELHHRFLIFPHKTSTNLIVVGRMAVMWGELEIEKLKEVAETLLEGGTEDDIPDSLKRIDYDSITKIECNLHDTMVSIDTGPENLLSGKLINFHTHDSRYRFLELLTRELNDGWVNQVRYYSRFGAAVLPMSALAGLGVILALILWASTLPELDPAKAHLRPKRRHLILSAFVSILGWIGWFGLACAIGALMLLALIWLLLRVATPPIEWTLTRQIYDETANEE